MVFLSYISGTHVKLSGEAFGEEDCAESTAPVPVRKDEERIGAAFGTGCCIDSKVAACWSPAVVRLRLRWGRVPDGHGERLLLPVLSVFEIEDLIANIEQGLGCCSSYIRVHGRATQDAEKNEDPDQTRHQRIDCF